MPVVVSISSRSTSTGSANSYIKVIAEAVVFEVSVVEVALVLAGVGIISRCSRRRCNSRRSGGPTGGHSCRAIKSVATVQCSSSYSTISQQPVDTMIV